MTRWEYARLKSTDEGLDVVFTHRQAWPAQAPEQFFDTLRRLGDEGWEVVSAMPLSAASRVDWAGKGDPDKRAGEFTVQPDRWLLLKRPVEEAPAKQETKGEDVLKGIVGRQLLKGRLPIP